MGRREDWDIQKRHQPELSKSLMLLTSGFGEVGGKKGSPASFLQVEALSQSV